MALSWGSTVRTIRLIVSREANCISTRLSAGHSKWSTPHPIHTSSASRGLEEFFPKTDDIIEEGEQAGRSWRASDLRQKSYEDLHKLWYVLLKERNMLLTLDKEANRHRYHIPAPERKHKIAKSMARLKFVIHERALAIHEAKQELGLIPRDEEKEEPKKKKKEPRYKVRRREKREQRKKKKLTTPDSAIPEPESIST